MCRDMFEQIPLTRAIDLLGAMRLLSLTNPSFFRSEEAFRCTTIEILRRETLHGRHVVSVDEETGSLSHTYRRDVSRQTRNEAFRYLYAAVGAAAYKLADLEFTRGPREKDIQANYYAAIERMGQDAA
jgi:hypothetical protein